jgi:hypothetical protein
MQYQHFDPNARCVGNAKRSTIRCQHSYQSVLRAVYCISWPNRDSNHVIRIFSILLLYVIVWNIVLQFVMVKEPFGTQNTYTDHLTILLHEPKKPHFKFVWIVINKYMLNGHMPIFHIHENLIFEKLICHIFAIFNSERFYIHKFHLCLA